MAGDVAQTVAAAVGMQRTRQVQRIDDRIGQRRHADAFEFFIEEVVVKVALCATSTLSPMKSTSSCATSANGLAWATSSLDNVGLF